MMHTLRSSMRLPALVALVAASALAPRPGHAQERSEPRLMFSFFGGISNGSALFDIPVQPLTVINTPLYDTLALHRSITSALSVGMNATLFGSSNIGVTAEIVYLGLRTDDSCDLLYEHPDPEEKNRAVCDDITQRTRTVSNVGITLGGAFRMQSRSAVSPYVRLQGGIGIRSLSIVQMGGRFPTSTGQFADRAVIIDQSESAVKPMFVGALGVMFALGSGYQIRAELRDQVLRLERPTGPADDLARVNKEGFWSHIPSLVFGVDIILEQKRGRRY
jgi:hypothetical protein